MGFKQTSGNKKRSLFYFYVMLFYAFFPPKVARPVVIKHK